MKTPAPFRFRAAFTLVEVLIGMAGASVVFMGVYAFLNSANILAAKSFAINITGTESRLSLDKIQMLLQQSYTVPIPINDQGVAQSTSLSITGAAAVASGRVPIVSGSSAVITGTGVGIKFNRIVGGPYLVSVPSGGISGTASSISFTMDTGAQVPAPAPKANDILSIYTTAILSGTNNQVNVTLGTVTTTTVSGNRVTYTADLASSILSGTSVTGIGQQKDSLQNVILPSALLLRPTAFVIVYPSTPISNPPSTPELRYIDSYVTGSGGNVDVTRYTSVVTNEIQPTTSGTTTIDANPSSFALVTSQSRPFVSLILHVRAQRYDQFLANKQRQDFATFMGIGSILISLKSVPN